MLALPLPILGKSRMRKRARTDLWGAISNGRPNSSRITACTALEDWATAKAGAIERKDDFPPTMSNYEALTNQGRHKSSRLSKRWSVLTRATLYVVMLVITFGSLGIYGALAFGPLRAKTGFVFLVVPAASWLLIAIVVAIAALISGRLSRRGDSA